MEAGLNTALLHAAPVVIVEDSDEDFDTLLEAAMKARVTQTVHRAATGGHCLALLRGEAGVCLSALPALIVMDLIRMASTVATRCWPSKPTQY